MSCLKELSLLLIVGSLSVFAANRVKDDKATPRFISPGDSRYFVNPLDFLYAKYPSANPPTAAKPEYPYPYPQPDYPNHHHHPTHPTYAPTPRPTRRPYKPKPSHGQYHQHSSYGYYPLYYSSPHQHPQQPPILLVYGSGHNHHHDSYDNWDKKNDDRLFVNNIVYPLSANVQSFDEFEDNDDTDFENEDFDSEYDGRNAKLNDVPVSEADSEEDNDSVAVAVDKLKLPLGIQLVNPAVPAIGKSNKKFKQQEALLYLKSLKNGRKLE